ncbi:MAG: PilZ domain-containing protein [Myxococcales bacterium]|nr:PilZ domain-containing protein [Myxococcales bacterium]
MKRLQLTAIPPAHGDDCVFIATSRAFTAGEVLLLALRRPEWPRAVVVVASVLATQSNGGTPPRRRGIWMYLPQASRDAALAFETALGTAPSAAQRRHERLPLALHMTARIGGRDYPLTTRDISVGGAALVGELPPAAKHLPLSLEVPGRQNRFKLKARIVYQKRADAGANESIGIIGAEFLNTGASELRLARTLRRIIAAL